MFGTKKKDAIVVNESDVDLFYSENLNINEKKDILIKTNTIKGKAISLLIDRLALGKDVRLPPAIIEMDYDKVCIYIYLICVMYVQYIYINIVWCILFYICN